MTDDRPKDVVSGRTTLHLEPFTQIFGATMGRSVYTGEDVAANKTRSQMWLFLSLSAGLVLT